MKRTRLTLEQLESRLTPSGNSIDWKPVDPGNDFGDGNNWVLHGTNTKYGYTPGYQDTCNFTANLAAGDCNIPSTESAVCGNIQMDINWPVTNNINIQGSLNVYENTYSSSFDGSHTINLDASKGAGILTFQRSGTTNYPANFYDVKIESVSGQGKIYIFNNGTVNLKSSPLGGFSTLHSDVFIGIDSNNNESTGTFNMDASLTNTVSLYGTIYNQSMGKINFNQTGNYGFAGSIDTASIVNYGQITRPLLNTNNDLTNDISVDMESGNFDVSSNIEFTGLAPVTFGNYNIWLDGAGSLNIHTGYGNGTDLTAEIYNDGGTITNDSASNTRVYVFGDIVCDDSGEIYFDGYGTIQVSGNVTLQNSATLYVDVAGGGHDCSCLASYSLTLDSTAAIVINSTDTYDQITNMMIIATTDGISDDNASIYNVGTPNQFDYVNNGSDFILEPYVP